MFLLLQLSSSVYCSPKVMISAFFPINQSMRIKVRNFEFLISKFLVFLHWFSIYWLVYCLLCWKNSSMKFRQWIILSFYSFDICKKLNQIVLFFIFPSQQQIELRGPIPSMTGRTHFFCFEKRENPSCRFFMRSSILELNHL